MLIGLCFYHYNFRTSSKSFIAEDSEEESEESDDEETLTNTLMLSGLCGCGTTAAVYACAKQMDFKVILPDRFFRKFLFVLSSVSYS